MQAAASALDANFRESHARCSELWGGCQAIFDRLKTVTLPSQRRFEARTDECNATLAACVGPAATDYASRLEKARQDGLAEFGEGFRTRLSHIVLTACVGGILVFRYVFVSGLGELICWLVLLAVEVLPRLNAFASLTPSSASFWQTPSGETAIQVYETIVYNEYIDVDDWLQVFFWLLVSGFVLQRCYRCYSRCGERKSRRRLAAARRYRKVRYEVDSDEEEDSVVDPRDRA